MLTITLANLRAEIASRADIEIAATTGRHTVARVNSLINASVRRYWLELAGHCDWVTTQATATTAAGTAVTSGWQANQHVALATNFLKLVGASISDGSHLTRLIPFAASEREDADDEWGNAIGFPKYFRVALNNAGAPILWLMPRAQAAYAITYHYIASPATLSADADLFSFFDGTEDFVICDVAKRILTRDGNPEPGQMQAILGEREEARRILVTHARSVGNGPGRKRDTRLERRAAYARRAP